MKKFAALFTLLLAALALVACGGGDDSTTGGGEDTAPATKEAEGKKEAKGGGGPNFTAEFEADPSGALDFTSDGVTSRAGEVTIDFTNSSPVPHDVAIENADGETIAQTKTIAEGSASTTADLEPGGVYTFYCSVPGHRQGGMEGTLRVE